jgi:hypothetical protein
MVKERWTSSAASRFGSLHPWAIVGQVRASRKRKVAIRVTKNRGAIAHGIIGLW